MTDLPRTERLLTDLRALVEAESFSEDVEGLRRCGQRLAELLAHQVGGEPILGDDGRVSWSHPGETVADHPVLILGHLDTVWPPGTLARKPFTVAAGRITGPGVFDMKAGIVVVIHALASLLGTGRMPGVRLLVTSDEETGSFRSRDQIEEEARWCRRVLVFEPCAEGGAIKRARKGVANGLVVVTGRAAHAGVAPHEGINAAVGLGQLLPQIAALAEPATGTTVTPTVMRAGTTTNTVPDQASVRLDVRFVEPAEIDRVRAGLEALVPANGAGIHAELIVNRPPLHPTASEPLLPALRDAEHALGLQLAKVTTGGASDGNFAAAAGAAVLDGLGPEGGAPHAEDEHVLLDGLDRRIALARELLPRVGAVPPT